MTLWPPGRTRQAFTRLGDTGHSVAALQLWMRAIGVDVAADGVFGPAMDKAVRAFQEQKRLVVDGIAGGATQRALVTQIMSPVTGAYRLPKYLFTSLCTAESNFILGEVNWDAPPGVDVGLIQDRITWGSGGPESIPEERWIKGFGPESAIQTCRELRERYDYNRPRYPWHTNRRIWELVTLWHNYPWAADRLLRGLEVSDEPAQWVIDVGISDVVSRADWCAYYIFKATARVDWSKV